MFDDFKRQNAKKNNTGRKITDICRPFITQLLKLITKHPDSCRENPGNENIPNNESESKKTACFNFGHIVGFALTGFTCGAIYGTVLTLKIMQYLSNIKAK